MDSVLLIQEDPAAGLSRSMELEQAGFEVTLNGETDNIGEALSREMPGILILMVKATGRGYYEQLERMGKDLSFPVMVLLEEWSTDEAVEALEAGVNEVVDASVPLRELAARIVSLTSLYRRFSDGYINDLQYEDLRMEIKGRKAFRGDEAIKLTPKEFDLLRYLMKRAEQVCQREAILQEVWGYDFSTGTNVVDVYIRHLRKKIDKGRSRKLIHTVRGTGYMIR
ncbi:response regulator transcription factor [Paenibacillus sp. M1]|uniref:Response regulator transcription factor n=1 Tax=Paenibacillus haidiansis TaxID=1574488 RepID=A0ABU7VWI5_9BACL